MEPPHTDKDPRSSRESGKMKSIFKPKRKRNHATTPIGPLRVAIEPLDKILRWCKELLSEPSPKCKNSAEDALLLPVRSPQEEKLRGALWYALTKQEEKQVDCPFDKIEKRARALSLSCEDVQALRQDVRAFPSEAEEQWPDLERIHYLCSIILRWKTSIQSPEDFFPDHLIIQNSHLHMMANQCQSDRVQKIAREAFLMAHVPWYDYERINAESAFGALCTIANQSVNSLVEAAGEELQNVVMQGPKKNTEYYDIAGIHVFLEYVRCKCGRTFTVYPLKDHKA